MNNDTCRSLQGFFAQYPLKSYHKGHILIYAGDDPSGIFYLETGKVRKYDINSTGGEVVLNVFVPPFFFPVSWVADEVPSKYFYEAMTPVEVRRAPIADFIAHLKENPEDTYALLKAAYSGIEGAQQRVVMLMGGSTSSRLLFELAIEAKRSGVMNEDGSCVISVSVSDLAQRAGLSRETINRELARLVNVEKIISRDGRSLVIHNFQTIESMIGNS